MGPRKLEFVPDKMSLPVPALVKVCAVPSSVRLLPRVVSAVLLTVRVRFAPLIAKVLFAKVSAEEPPMVRLAFSAKGYSMVRAPPEALTVEAALTVTAPVPSGPEVITPPEETVSTPRLTVPALRVVPPE